MTGTLRERKDEQLLTALRNLAEPCTADELDALIGQDIYGVGREHKSAVYSSLKRLAEAGKVQQVLPRGEKLRRYVAYPEGAAQVTAVVVDGNSVIVEGELYVRSTPWVEKEDGFLELNAHVLRVGVMDSLAGKHVALTLAHFDGCEEIKARQVITFRVKERHDG